jgi:carnitine-CoA ligase
MERGIKTSVTLPPAHAFSGMDVASALATRAERFADRTFLIWEPKDGRPASWTYRQFFAEVAKVAAGLAARGVGPGDPVMLLLDNSPAFLLCWFACARLGAVAVDTNTRYRAQELRHALGLTGPAPVITHPQRRDDVASLTDLVPWSVTIDESTGTCPQLTGDPDSLAVRHPDPAAPMCVQFTSGTTSRPKAVLFTHANALWGGRVGATHAGLSGSDVTLVYGPLFHTAALSWQTLATFWVGGTVVLLPKYTASRFWDISLRHRCTHTNLLGIMIQTLAEQDVPDHHYRSWQFGLESPEIEQRYRLRLFNAWGMTEVVTQPIINDLLFPSEPRAIGRVAPEYQIRVTDAHGNDTAIGEPGDLLVLGRRGLSVFAEYLADPAATADVFDHAGYFRTGDRVTIRPSGDIEFAGRAKDMLKVGGENVAAAEIERVLTAVPAIRTAAVVGRPDRYLDEVPVAFVTVAPGATGDDVRLRAEARCRAELADFKVPRAIYAIDELPEALLGKIAKGQLRARAIELAATDAKHRA